MERELIVLTSIIGIHLLWVLAPLVPAILIYWLFPSTTVAVTGPLASLSVRAGGAFAAYLVVFAATYPIADRALETIGGFQKVYWTLEAQVALQDTKKQVIEDQELLTNLIVTTKPGALDITDNRVRLAIPQVGSLPHVLFDIPRFGRISINLRENTENYEIDTYSKIITLKKPVIITQQFPNQGM
jgi:hypothetical protein